MRPYLLLLAVSSNEALAKLPPDVERLARSRLRELAASQPDESAPGEERPLKLFEIPPYAFAYVVDHDVRAIALERIYVVFRAKNAGAPSWPQLITAGDKRPVRH
jgi:hypothetical protein